MADVIKEYVIKIKTDIQDTDKQLESLSKKLSKIEIGANLDASIQKQTDALTGSIGKLTQEFNNLSKSFDGKALSDEIKSMADSISKSIDSMKKSFDGFADTFSVFNSGTGTSGLGTTLKEFTSQMDSLMNSYQMSMNALQGVMDGSLNTKAFQKQTSSMGQGIKNTTKANTQDIDDAIRALKESLLEYSKASDDIYEALDKDLSKTFLRSDFEGFEALLRKLEQNANKAKSLGIDISKIFKDMGLSIDLTTIKKQKDDITKQVEATRNNIADPKKGKTSGSSKSNKPITISLDVVLDKANTDDRSINKIVSDIQNSIQEKVQSRIAKNPIKIPMAFAAAVKNVDEKSEKEIFKELSGDSEEAAEGLLASVKVSVDANVTDLTKQINDKIKELNSSGNLSKIEVDVIPRELDKNQLDAFADDVTIRAEENMRMRGGTGITSGNITATGNIQNLNIDSSGLATENTLRAILGALTGKNTDGIKVTADSGASGEVIDTGNPEEQRKLKNYFGYMGFKVRKNSKISKEYAGVLSDRKLIGEALSAEVQKREGTETLASLIRKRDSSIDDLKNSKIFTSKYSYDGKDYALYGDDKELLKDFQERLTKTYTEAKDAIRQRLTQIDKDYSLEALNKSEIETAKEILQNAKALSTDNPDRERLLSSAQSRLREIQTRPNGYKKWQDILYEEDLAQQERDLKPSRSRKITTELDDRIRNLEAKIAKAENANYKSEKDRAKRLDPLNTQLADLKSQRTNWKEYRRTHNDVTEDEAVKGYITEYHRKIRESILAATDITPDFERQLKDIKDKAVSTAIKEVSQNKTKSSIDQSSKRIKSLAQDMTGLGVFTDEKTGQMRVDWKTVATNPQQGLSEIRTALKTIRDKAEEDIKGFRESIEIVDQYSDDLHEFINLGTMQNRTESQESRFNELKDGLKATLDKGAYFYKYSDAIDSAQLELDSMYKKLGNGGVESSKQRAKREELQDVISGTVASSFEYTTEELVQSAKMMFEQRDKAEQEIKKIGKRVKAEQQQLIYGTDYAYRDRRYDLNSLDKGVKTKLDPVANARRFRQHTARLVPISDWGYKQQRDVIIPELEKSIGALQSKMTTGKNGGFDTSSLTTTEAEKYKDETKRLMQLRIAQSVYEAVNNITPKDYSDSNGVYRTLGLDKKQSDIFKNLPTVQELEGKSSKELTTLLSNLQGLSAKIGEKSSGSLTEEQMQEKALQMVADDISALEKQADEIRVKIAAAEEAKDDKRVRQLNKDLDDTTLTLGELRGGKTEQTQIIEKAKAEIQKIEAEESTLLTDAKRIFGLDDSQFEDFNKAAMELGDALRQEAEAHISLTQTTNDLGVTTAELEKKQKPEERNATLQKMLNLEAVKKRDEELLATATAERKRLESQFTEAYPAFKSIDLSNISLRGDYNLKDPTDLITYIINEQADLNERRAEQEDLIYEAQQRLEKTGQTEGAVAEKRVAAYVDQMKRANEEVNSAMQTVSTLMDAITGTEVEVNTDSVYGGYRSSAKVKKEGYLEKAKKREMAEAESKLLAEKNIQEFLNLPQEAQIKEISDAYDRKIQKYVEEQNKLTESLSFLEEKRNDEIEIETKRISNAEKTLESVMDETIMTRHESKSLDDRIKDYSIGTEEQKQKAKQLRILNSTLSSLEKKDNFSTEELKKQNEIEIQSTKESIKTLKDNITSEIFNSLENALESTTNNLIGALQEETAYNDNNKIKSLTNEYLKAVSDYRAIGGKVEDLGQIYARTMPDLDRQKTFNKIASRYIDSIESIYDIEEDVEKRLYTPMDLETRISMYANGDQSQQDKYTEYRELAERVENYNQRIRAGEFVPEDQEIISAIDQLQVARGEIVSEIINSLKRDLEYAKTRLELGAKNSNTPQSEIKRRSIEYLNALDDFKAAGGIIDDKNEDTHFIQVGGNYHYSSHLGNATAEEYAQAQLEVGLKAEVVRIAQQEVEDAKQMAKINQEAYADEKESLEGHLARASEDISNWESAKQAAIDDGGAKFIEHFKGLLNKQNVQSSDKNGSLKKRKNIIKGTSVEEEEETLLRLLRSARYKQTPTADGTTTMGKAEFQKFRNNASQKKWEESLQKSWFEKNPWLVAGMTEDQAIATKKVSELVTRKYGKNAKKTWTTQNEAELAMAQNVARSLGLEIIENGKGKGYVKSFVSRKDYLKDPSKWAVPTITTEKAQAAGISTKGTVQAPTTVAGVETIIGLLQGILGALNGNPNLVGNSQQRNNQIPQYEPEEDTYHDMGQVNQMFGKPIDVNVVGTSNKHGYSKEELSLSRATSKEDYADRLRKTIQSGGHIIKDSEGKIMTAPDSWFKKNGANYEDLTPQIKASEEALNQFAEANYKVAQAQTQTQNAANQTGQALEYEADVIDQLHDSMITIEGRPDEDSYRPKSRKDFDLTKLSEDDLQKEFSIGRWQIKNPTAGEDARSRWSMYFQEVQDEIARRNQEIAEKEKDKIQDAEPPKQEKTPQTPSKQENVSEKVKGRPKSRADKDLSQLTDEELDKEFFTARSSKSNKRTKEENRQLWDNYYNEILEELRNRKEQDAERIESLNKAIEDYTENKSVENAQSIMSHLLDNPTFANADSADFKATKNGFTYRDAKNPQGYKVTLGKDNIQIEAIDNAIKKYSELFKLQEQLNNFVQNDYLSGLLNGGFNEGMLSDGELEKLREAKDLFEELKVIRAEGFFDENGNLLPDIDTKTIKGDMQTIQNIIRSLTKDVGGKIQVDFDFKDFSNARAEMEAWARATYGAEVAIEGFADGNRKMMFSVRTADDIIEKHILSVDNMHNAYDEMISATEYLNPLQRIMGGLGEKTQELIRYSIASVGIYDVIRVFEEAISMVTEMDTAMTNLQKVAEGTEAQFNSFRDSSYKIAAETGSTATSVVDAATEWARLGYNLDESAELSKASIIYSNVGELDATTATTDLVSTLKAFDKEASEAMNIVDVLNEIGNNYAVSSEQLGEILEKSSATLAVSGDSMEQVVAMGAAMNEVVQDASVTGSTLKVLGLRLRGAKTEIQDMGEETDGMAESTSKLREKILALTNVTGDGGFDIMLDSKTFKTTYDMMEGIANVWEDMSQIDQAALLELIAGKNRAQGTAALLGNWSKAQEALSDASNASGSAMRENDRYMDSIKGKITQFQNQLQSLANTTIKSDLVKGVVEFGTKALKILTEIIDKFGAIKSVIVAFSAGSMFRNIFKNMAKDSELSFFKAFQNEGLVKGIVSAFGQLGEQFDLFASSGNKLQAVGQIIINVFKGIGGAITAHPIVATITAIAAAFALFDRFHISAEEANEQMKNSMNDYESAKNKVEEVNSELTTTKQRMAELTQKSISGSITFVEQEELDRLKESNEQLALAANLADKESAKAAKQFVKDTVSAYKKNVKTPVNEETYSTDMQNFEYSMNAAGMNNIVAQIDVAKRLGGDAVDDLKTQALDLLQQLNTYKENLESVPESLLTNEEKVILDEINGSIEYIYKNVFPSDWTNIQYSNLISNEDNKKFEQSAVEMSKLAKANNKAGISVDELKEKYSDFVKAAEEFGITPEQLTQQVNSLADEQIKESEELDKAVEKKVVKKYDSFAELMNEEDAEGEKSFSTRLSEYEDYMSKIQDLRSKIADKSLTPSDIKTAIEDFKDYPEIAQAASQGVDQLDIALTALAEKLTGTYSVFGESTGIMSLFQDSMKGLTTEEARTQLQALIDTILQLYNVTGAVSDMEFLNNLSGITQNVTSSISSLQSVYETVSNPNMTNDEWLSMVSSNPELFSKTRKIDGKAIPENALTAINIEKISVLQKAISDIRESTAEITDPGKLKLVEDTIDHLMQSVDFSNINLDTAKSFFTDNMAAGIQDAQKSSKIKKKFGNFAEAVFDKNTVKKMSSKAFQTIDDELSDQDRWNILFKLSADTSLADASLDEIWERYQEIATNMKEMDFMESPLMDTYTSAKQAGEAGDRYKEMITAYKELLELEESGEVGTNQYNAGTAMFSPQGISGYDNFQGNKEKIERYLTEDSTGMHNLLEDMEKVGLATSEVVNGSKQWSFNIDNAQEAADKLGISYEFFTASMGRLKDYGANIDYFGNIPEGITHLTDLYGQLNYEETKLQELREAQSRGETGVTDEVIAQQEARVEQIRQSIQNTNSLLDELLSRTVSQYEEENKAAGDTITSLIDQASQTTNKSVHDRIVSDIQSLAEEYHIQLLYDTEGNIIGIVEESIEEAQDTANENPVTIKEEVEQEEQTTHRQNLKEEQLTPREGMMPSEQRSREQMASVTLGFVKTGSELIMSALDTGIEKLSSTYAPEGGGKLEKSEQEINKQAIDDFNTNVTTIGKTFRELATQSGLVQQVMDPLQRVFNENIQRGNGFVGAQEIVEPVEKMGNDFIKGLESFNLGESVGELTSAIGSFIPSLLTKEETSHTYTPQSTAQPSAGGGGKFSVNTQGVTAEIPVTGKVENVETDGVQPPVIGVDGEVQNVEVSSEETGTVQLNGEINTADAISEFNKTAQDLADTSITMNASIQTDTSTVGAGLDAGLINITADTTEAIQSITEAKNTADSTSGQLTIKGNASPALSTVSNAVSTIRGMNPTLNVGANTSSVSSSISSALRGPFNITVNANVVGMPKYTGTMLSVAHASGTAYNVKNYIPVGNAKASGDVAIDEDETALVNELGTESIIRDGKWFLIPGGMQTYDLKKGDK